MARAGSLIVQLAVDLAKFRSDMTGAAQISNTKLREIQRATQDTVNQMSRVGRSIQTAFGFLGVSVGIASLVGAFKQAASAAIQYGDEVQKAALKTGLGAGQFAQLAEAAKLADVDMQTLSKSLRFMQVEISKLGSSDKGAIKTFQALGIELKNLENLSADKQLELIAEQLSRLKSPADQARLGVEVFGKAWDSLAPFLLQGAAGIRKAREEIGKLGGALTDTQIEKLADADDAIKQLSFSWNQFARTLTGSVAPALTEVLKQLSGMKTAVVDNARASQIEAMLKSRGGIPDKFFPDSEALRRELSQIKQRERDRLLGPGRQVRAGTNLAAPPGPQAEVSTSRDKRALDEITVSAKRMFDMAEASKAAFADVNETSLRENADFFREMSNGYFVMSQEMKDWWKELASDSEKAFSVMTVFAEEAGRNMQDALAEFLFDPFSEGLDGMLAGFVDVVRQMVAQLASQQILGAFFGWGASTFGGAVGDAFGSMLKGIGGKAAGGPVSAGGAYVVGEKGPELLLMGNQGGTIIPSGAGGNVSVHYSIDARGADADRIMAMLPPLLKQTRDQTIADVLRMQRQGRLA